MSVEGSRAAGQQGSEAHSRPVVQSAEPSDRTPQTHGMTDTKAPPRGVAKLVWGARQGRGKRGLARGRQMIGQNTRQWFVILLMSMSRRSQSQRL